MPATADVRRAPASSTLDVIWATAVGWPCGASFDPVAQLAPSRSGGARRRFAGEETAGCAGSSRGGACIGHRCVAAARRVVAERAAGTAALGRSRPPAARSLPAGRRFPSPHVGHRRALLPSTTSRQALCPAMSALSVPVGVLRASHAGWRLGGARSVHLRRPLPPPPPRASPPSPSSPASPRYEQQGRRDGRRRLAQAGTSARHSRMEWRCAGGCCARRARASSAVSWCGHLGGRPNMRACRILYNDYIRRAFAGRVSARLSTAPSGGTPRAMARGWAYVRSQWSISAAAALRRLARERWAFSRCWRPVGRPRCAVWGLRQDGAVHCGGT